VDGNTAFRFNQQDASLAGFEVVVDIHPHPLDWLHFENSFSYVRGRFSDGVEGNRNIPFIPAGRWLSELRGDFLKEGKTLRNLSLRFQLDNTLAQKKIFEVFNTETITAAYTLLNAGLSADLFAGKKNFASIYFKNFERLRIRARDGPA
jgi:iron complex outermembrane receptor protein